MHYAVVIAGHVAIFSSYEDACAFADDFDGDIFNMAGLR